MIRHAGPDDLQDIRKMLEEYQRALNLDLSFQHFKREVDGLPGEYVPPTGALLVARIDGTAAGMVALRRRSDIRCEMKRLFVRPFARGTGLGRALAEQAIQIGRARGYRQMVLDTLPSMGEAHALYAALGFRAIPAYYPSPIVGTTYLALDL